MDRIDEPGNTEMPNIPAITTEQMIDIDRAMVDDYGIDLTRMMENAVRSLASLARTRFLDGDPTDKRVAVLAGPGGNGLVCARRLSAWGASVEVHMSKPAGEITGVPAEQFPIFHRMDVPVHQPGPESTKEPDLTGADLVIDALLGYRLQGAPRGHPHRRRQPIRCSRAVAGRAQRRIRDYRRHPRRSMPGGPSVWTSAPSLPGKTSPGSAKPPYPYLDKRKVLA